MSRMTDELEVAVEVAREAGEILRVGWSRDELEVERKGPTNPVTEVDRRSEALIVECLRASFPGYGLLAEEGHSIPGESDARWIVDPLDGTTNYIKRIPWVAVSIGLEIAGRLVLGVIYNPILEELYMARAGEGASLNGAPIHVSTVHELGQAVLGTGFPYDTWENSRDNTAEWRHFIKRCHYCHCDGSAALDLCQVAMGRLDGYWEMGLSSWDMAAGIVIVREAGGLVTDYAGGDTMLTKGEIVSANPALQAYLRRDLGQVKAV